MNFDYTYIYLFGFIFYEPMVALTNTIFFLSAIIFFKKIVRFNSMYAKHMANFILLLGMSAFIGAIGHVVHYQLGHTFFKFILLLMNTFSLFAAYFLFRASYIYADSEGKLSNLYMNLVLVWIILVLVVSWWQADFTLIKIQAAIVLLYTLYVHYSVYSKTKARGTELLILGVFVSFLPIIVHSLHISLYKWFNHKDLSHVLMIVSLCIIYSGLISNVRLIDEEVEA